jgi:tetratricopeptide (TPR) repeat protein
MPRQIAVFTLALAILHVGGAAADPTADEYAATGRAALEHGRYHDALDAYRSAYNLDPTSVRALFVAIASSYALALSSSIDDLETWLDRKKTEANAAGDTEASWAKLTDLVKAYRAAAKRAETLYVTEHTTVKRLTDANKALEDRLGKLQTELDQTRLDRDHLLDLHDLHEVHQPPP